MRRIPFDPTDRSAWSPEMKESWEAWEKRAEKAAGEVTDGHQDLDSAIWRDLKKWLLKYVFEKKCAYCESVVSAGFFGEADHYRPKSRVRSFNHGKPSVVRDSKGEQHPGYFWLAYDWTNLLPACQECNNAKSDKFPIQNAYEFEPRPGTAALNPVENPLLLHPYFDEPENFLRFGDGGVVVAVDGNSRGQTTIDVFKLDRADLEDLRRAQQDLLRKHILLQLKEVLEAGAEFGKYLEPFTGRKAAYSVACQDIIAGEIERLAALLKGIADGFRPEDRT